VDTQQRHYLVVLDTPIWKRQVFFATKKLNLNYLQNIVPRAATIVGNNTAITNVFQRLVQQFDTMFHKKAYLHWYTGEGMDVQEFEEAAINMKDLISEYQMRGEGSDEEGHMEELEEIIEIL
jgi:hypothetical protein